MRHHKQYAIKFKVFLKFSDMRHDQVLNSFIFFPFSTVSLFFPLLGFFLSGFDILDIFSGFDISQVDYCGRLRQLIVNILNIIINMIIDHDWNWSLIMIIMSCVWCWLVTWTASLTIVTSPERNLLTGIRTLTTKCLRLELFIYSRYITNLSIYHYNTGITTLTTKCFKLKLFINLRHI